ncbi:MAG: corrinoid protein [Candidatus Helarchaeota archaeon]
MNEDTMNVLEAIADAVVKGDADAAVALAEKIVNEKIVDLNEAILNGLNRGMQIVSELYEKREYFLPEIIVAADALYEALAVFKPYLQTDSQKFKATVVCGVVRGDIHDIGKNIVKLFLEASGFKVIDLGRNVPSEAFITAIKEHNADILALSTLMSPTLDSMREVVNLLNQAGLQHKVKVIIGGAAPDVKFAAELNVLFFEDAPSVVKYLNSQYSGGVE